LAAALVCADTPVVPAFRVTTPPTIDGVIHEDSEWKGVPSLSGLVSEQDGAKAPDSGTFWIAYDDKYVYVAARMLDSEPRQIRGTEYQTNVSLQGDDYFQFDLDVSGSMNDFNTFQVNPRGATNTSLAGGRALKREWAGEFLTAARITSTGWEAELRIPWQLMLLPPAGKRDVRINFERYQARRTRMYSSVYFGTGYAQQQPIWRGVEIPKQIADRTIKLLP